MINKKTRIALIFATLVTFIALTNLSFAQCIDTCIDNDNDTYTPDTTCNTNESCPFCKCNDCDDDYWDKNPSAEEDCGSGLDMDCDGDYDCDDFDCCDAVELCSTSSSLLWADQDEDGYTICEGDCDDDYWDKNPGAEEDCGSGLDMDCDGLYDCEDPDCAGDPYCNNGIPEYPIGYIIPILLTLLATYKRKPKPLSL